MEGDRSDIALLARRLGFGLRPDEIDALVPQGYEAAVDWFLASAASSAGDPADQVAPPELSLATVGIALDAGVEQTAALITYWLQRIVATDRPLVEKMALLWHGHFATAIYPVGPANMYRQNRILRSMGLGDFGALTLALARDPAMLIWLDANDNVAGNPNENFAREVMELFTLGIGSYSEGDVREAARAFTGWTIDKGTQEFTFRPELHDTGVKTVLGRTGPLTGEDVIAWITSLPQCTRWVTATLWSHLAYPVASDDPVVRSVVRQLPSGWTIAQLVRTIVLHPTFRSATTRSGLVKQPVEWLCGSLRALRLPVERWMLAGLQQLGQLPFAPPDVGGWPQNGYWISAASAGARINIAARLAAAADLTELTGVAPPNRPQALGRLLGIDAWSATTAAALAQRSSDPRGQLALALVSPEYVLS